MQYTIGEIAGIINAELVTFDGNENQKERKINWLLTDSRSLCFPEETLFFALKSQRNDGHRYIEELYHRGVCNFVVEQTEGLEHLKHACLLKVSNTLDAPQNLASYHRNQFNIPVIAITGSNGKTTVKEWLYQVCNGEGVLEHRCKSCDETYLEAVSAKGHNPGSKATCTEDQICRDCGAVIETGISKPGEMERLNKIVKPTIGVITNVGQAHQENFLSLQIKCTEKMMIFKGCQTAVLNLHNSTISQCASTLPENVRRMAWNTASGAGINDTDVIIREVVKEGNKATVKFEYQNELGQYTIPFIDDAAIENSITCFTTCLSIGMQTDVIAKRMEKLEPVAMRLEVKDGINGCTIINDTYNSDIHSLNIALDFMSRRPDTKEQKRTLILSDILQSGESARSLYSRVAQMAQNKGSAPTISTLRISISSEPPTTSSPATCSKTCTTSSSSSKEQDSSDSTNSATGSPLKFIRPSLRLTSMHWSITSTTTGSSRSRKQKWCAWSKPRHTESGPWKHRKHCRTTESIISLWQWRTREQNSGMRESRPTSWS